MREAISSFFQVSLFSFYLRPNDRKDTKMLESIKSHWCYTIIISEEKIPTSNYTFGLFMDFHECLFYFNLCIVIYLFSFLLVFYGSMLTLREAMAYGSPKVEISNFYWFLIDIWIFCLRHDVNLNNWYHEYNYGNFTNRDRYFYLCILNFSEINCYF